MGNYGRKDSESERREREAWRRSQSWRPSERRDEYFGGSMQMGQGYTGNTARDYSNYSRDYEGGYGDPTSSGTREDRYPGESSYRNRDYGRNDQGGFNSVDRTNRFNDRFSGYEGDAGSYQGRRSRYGYSNYPESESGYEGPDRNNERGWWDKTSDEVSSWFGDEEAARRRRMDARTGPHRGRGPSTYSRSDERVKEDINDRLTDHSYLDASNVDVEVSSGEVTLTGTVNDRHSKRLAEDIAEDVSGVKNVENRLRVADTAGFKNSEGTADISSRSAVGGSRS